jgi:hypothetical protein
LDLGLITPTKTWIWSPNPSVATSQVEMEDPNPSEEKEAPVTVVDLTKEEAIEDPTQSHTLIEED